MQDLVRQELAATANLIVVKVGTRVLTRDDGILDLDRIKSLAEQIHALRESGRQVVLISSGAVGASSRKGTREILSKQIVLLFNAYFP